MLLQQIVRQLDAELDRLKALRAIVFDLQRSAPNLEQMLSLPAAAATASGTEDVAPRRRGRPRKIRPEGPEQRPVRRAASALLPTALTKAIPGGPVVVYPAKLARGQELRSPAPVVAQAHQEIRSKGPTEDSEALVRNLTARWVANAG